MAERHEHGLQQENFTKNGRPCPLNDMHPEPSMETAFGMLGTGRQIFHSTFCLIRNMGEGWLIEVSRERKSLEAQCVTIILWEDRDRASSLWMRDKCNDQTLPI